MPNDIETENLAAHVAVCEERYQQLDLKINFLHDKVDDMSKQLDKRIENIEAAVSKIADQLEDHNKSTYEKILHVGGWLIGALLTGGAWLVVHTFLK